MGFSFNINFKDYDIDPAAFRESFDTLNRMTPPTSILEQVFTREYGNTIAQFYIAYMRVKTGDKSQVDLNQTWIMNDRMTISYPPSVRIGDAVIFDELNIEEAEYEIIEPEVKFPVDEAIKLNEPKIPTKEELDQFISVYERRKFRYHFFTKPGSFDPDDYRDVF